MNLFARCSAAYQAGNFDYEKDYTEEDLAFLKNIGYKKREMFDFVEDYVDGKVPSPTTALLVAAVRRDYFLAVQNGNWSDKVLTREDVPSFGEELDGIDYLPRIIAKAEAKLRGELDPDLMYSCGGDRNFLSKHGDICPADFLRHVWAADGDDSKVAKWVSKCSGQS
ncbi:MAG: DUF5069 domain-containing protein [Akkermansiaceae bacterium]